MIYDFTPYSISQKLFDAYAECMSLLKPEDYAIFRDADCCYCSPNYMEVIYNATRQHPDVKCFTALTNRISCDFQKDLTAPQGNDYALHRAHGIARQKQYFSKVKQAQGTMSGFWMCIRKDLWDKIERPTTTRILHVDTHIAKQINGLGEKTLVLQGLYLYHYYGDYTGEGKRNVSHLL